MFNEFKQKIVKDYTKLTTILLLCVSLIMFFVSLSISYKEQLKQLRMLSIEESEEVFMKLNTGTIEEFDSLDELPDNDANYFNRIFIYGYDSNARPLFRHNDISWSKDMVEKCIADNNVEYNEAIFHFQLLDNRHPKALLFMRYPLLKNNAMLGELYVGIEITHWVREQARIFFILLFVILLSTIFVHYLSLKMAEKAMVPVVKSFEQEKQFIANASHELRTPLSIIMSGITVLKSDEDNKLSPFSQDIVEDIHDESRRMKKLIDDLLLTARSDNNTLKINPTEFYLRDILIKLYNKFSLLSANKNIAINIPEEIPDIKIYADITHIEQILIILIDNAIKYTDENGQITLSIKQHKYNIAINVKDTGKGISKQDLPHIFERFYRADKARTQHGNGLGLSIAQMLAKKNHSHLKVESKLNEGSTFSLIIEKI